MDRPGRGTKREADTRMDTKIMREVKRNPKVTVREIQETLQLSVSGRTVRRRLVAQGLINKVARKRKTNKTKRLRFAIEHADKFWKTVLGGGFVCGADRVRNFRSATFKAWSSMEEEM